MRLLSFIIPCYGSEKTISKVVEEIKETVSLKEEYDYEIIAVNDCSPDNVWSVIKSLSENDERVKGLHLAKNVNRPGAVMAGLKHMSGEVAVIMDDDGQCPIDKLWELLKPLDEGYDVSMAKYPERKQSKFKDFGTVVNKKMTQFMLNKPKDLEFSNFMAIKSYIVDEMVEYENPYPYLTGLILRTSKFLCNVPMEQRSRMEGRSTFTFSKMLSLWMNGLTAFSIKPLRIATLCGIICSLLGFGYGIFTIIYKLVNENVAIGYSSLMAVMLFIGGAIMMMLGLIGEYIGRIYISINNSPQYVIKETLNIERKSTR